MDVASSASAILAIATAGAQCAFKLISFASQIQTAPESISHVAEDVSITTNILQQLSDIIKEDLEEKKKVGYSSDPHLAANSSTTSSATLSEPPRSILNESALNIALNLAKGCSDIFRSLNLALQAASEQLSARPRTMEKITLSLRERLKWPFLQPEIESMRKELASKKATLTLMLLVAMLAYSQKVITGYVIYNCTPLCAAAAIRCHKYLIFIRRQSSKYTKEDQDFLVRAILSAQSSQTEATEAKSDLPVDSVATAELWPCSKPQTTQNDLETRDIFHSPQ